MAAEAPFEHPQSWPVVSLAELTLKIGSGATPRGGSHAYLQARLNYAFVRSQNVYDRRFDSDGLAFISDDQALALQGARLRPRDILLNITGDGVTFGRACLVPNSILPACVNQHVCIIRVDATKVEPGYVLAYLTHPEVKGYIESFNAGGSRRAVTKGHIESFLIPLPPLPLQRAIARILGAFEEKLELNERMNATIGALTSALFLRWIAENDDDLVARRAAELEAKGILEIGDGYRAKNTELTTSDLGLPFARAGNLDGGFHFQGAERLRSENVPLAGSKLSEPWDAVFTSKGTVGRVAQVLPSTPRFVYSPQLCFWRSRNVTRLHPQVLLEWLHSREFREQVDSVKGQTDMADYVSLRDQRDMEVSLPWTKSQAEIGGRLAVLRDQVSLNWAQSSKLVQLRDALLPRLLSGEVSPEGVKRDAGAAA